MSDQTSSANSSGAQDRGKGKAVDQHNGGDMSMNDDEDDEEEESGNEDEVPEAEEDNLEEIDSSNIVGSRTRGKNIDWNEAEQKLKDEGMDEDEDDDEDDGDFEGDEDDEMQD